MTIQGLGGALPSSNHPSGNPINRDPEATYESTQSDIGEISATVAKHSFTTAGVLTGVFLLVETVAAIGLVGAAATTPVGKAALGVLGVALAVVSVSHFCETSTGHDPQTENLLKEGAENPLKATATAYLSLALLGCLCMTGGTGEKEQNQA